MIHRHAKVIQSGFENTSALAVLKYLQEPFRIIFDTIILVTTYLYYFTLPTYTSLKYVGSQFILHLCSFTTVAHFILII